MVSWRMLFPRYLVGIVSVCEEKNNRMFPLYDDVVLFKLKGVATLDVDSMIVDSPG